MCLVCVYFYIIIRLFYYNEIKSKKKCQLWEAPKKLRKKEKKEIKRVLESGKNRKGKGCLCQGFGVCPCVHMH